MNDHSMPQVGDDERAGFSPGAALRGARVARGLSVEEVAHALKLAPRQIEAIEADAFDQLRGLTFARGFVRNYARHLGLDAEPLVAAIVSDVDLRQIELAPVSNARGEMPVARSSLGTLLPAGITLAVLVAVALAGWHFGWFRVPTAGVSLEQAAPAAVEVSKPVDAPQPQAGLAVETPPQPVAGPAPEVVPPPIAASAAATAPATAATPEPAAKAPPALGTQRLSFQFEGDSWVEIRDGRGKVVHSQLHKAGSADDIDVGVGGPHALVVGNAGSVRLRVNGQPVDLAPHVRVSVARLNVQ